MMNERPAKRPNKAQPRGPYRERTRPVRVPLSLLGEVETLLKRRRQEVQSKNAA
jgi:hypothetical protein